MTRLSSAKYLRGSKGQQCTLRIEGVCTGDTETTVAAHIRDRHKGGGNKASDISVANACYACHMVFDRQAKMPDGSLIDTPAWNAYALRGLQETLEQRIEAGLLIFPHDAPTERKPAARKPREQRAAIPKPKDHKWPSRPWGKKKEGK